MDIRVIKEPSRTYAVQEKRWPWGWVTIKVGPGGFDGPARFDHKSDAIAFAKTPEVIVEWVGAQCSIARLKNYRVVKLKGRPGFRIQYWRWYLGWGNDCDAPVSFSYVFNAIIYLLEEPLVVVWP